MPEASIPRTTASYSSATVRERLPTGLDHTLVGNLR